MQFSDYLKAERDRLGLGQEEFAALGEVSKRSYVYYETGDRSPNTDFLTALANNGVDIVYLLTGKRQAQFSVTEPSPAYNSITADESCLINNYRYLSDDDKALIQRQADVFAKYSQLKERDAG